MVDVTVHRAGASDAERMMGVIAYLLGFVTGLPILFIGRKSRFLRFHAWQSIIGSVAVGGIVGLAIWAVFTGPLFELALSMWLFLLLACQWYDAYLVYHGISFRTPVIADVIERYLVK